MFRVVERVVAGPHDHAAVVRRNLQPVERMRHPLGDGLVADVVDEDLQQMSHAQAAGVVVQPACGQRLVDAVRQFRRILHVVVGLAQVDEARAARRNELSAVVVELFGQRQVARDQRIGRQRREREVLGRPAAIPVLHLRRTQCRAAPPRPWRTCDTPTRCVPENNRDSIRTSCDHLRRSAWPSDSLSSSLALSRMALSWSMFLDAVSA